MEQLNFLQKCAIKIPRIILDQYFKVAPPEHKQQLVRWKLTDRVMGLTNNATLPYSKEYYIPILTNTVNYHILSNPESVEQVYNDTTKFDILHCTKFDILHCTKLVLDKLNVMRDIVGIQPLTGPVGLVYRMQYSIQSENVSTELEAANEISLEITRSPVEACARKLQTKFPLEAIQDILYHTVDLHLEYLNAVSSAIANEIVDEILTDLLKAATPFEQSKVSQFEHSDTDQLLLKIHLACNNIAKDTRRGAANVVIADAVTCQTLIDIGAVDNVIKVTGYGDALEYIGTLHSGHTKLFCTNLPQCQNKIILGYKGLKSQIDTGFNYCPYMILREHLSVDADTFQPYMTFWTRYGKLNVRGTIFEPERKTNPYYQVIDLTK